MFINNKDEYTKMFSNNLRKAMEGKGYRAKDLAAMCNTSKSAVSQWLNGNRLPRLDKIDKIAEVLGVSRDTLTGDKDIQMEVFFDTSPEIYDLAKRIYKNRILYELFKETENATISDIELLIDTLKALKRKNGDKTDLIK